MVVEMSEKRSREIPRLNKKHHEPFPRKREEKVGEQG
jgi:hypothetical protein